MDLGYNIYPVNLAFDEENRIIGSNQKGILIVYATGDKVHLDFLNKILSAIEISMDNVLTLAIKEQETIKIQENFGGQPISKILVFGILPKRICLNSIVEKYMVTEIKDTKVIFADSLEQVKNTKELKKNLWLSLKELFGV